MPGTHEQPHLISPQHNSCSRWVEQILLGTVTDAAETRAFSSLQVKVEGAALLWTLEPLLRVTAAVTVSVISLNPLFKQAPGNGAIIYQ